MITEFRIGCSHTINLGDYNSIRVEASVTVAVQDGEKVEDLKEGAQRELRALLEETYKAQRRHQG